MKTQRYILYTDGGSRGNPGPAAYGAVLFDPNEKLVWISGKYLGEMTNNQAEYEGIIRGLLMAKGKKVKDITVYVDSDLAYKQITGQWKAKDKNIRTLLKRVENIIHYFDSVEFHHTPRKGNLAADRVLNIVLDAATT